MTLRERLSATVHKFCSFFLSLLGDREYDKVLVTIAEVNKALGSQASVTTPACCSPRSFRPQGFVPSGPQAPTCYYCRIRGHTIPHAEKTFKLHYEASTALESTGKTKEGPPQEKLEEGYGKRDEGPR